MVKTLLDHTNLVRHPALGCERRNLWAPELPWRWRKGVLYLRYLEIMDELMSDGWEEHTFFFDNQYRLWIYRAGPKFRDYWIADVCHEVGLVNENGWDLKGGVILWEHDDQLEEVPIPLVPYTLNVIGCEFDTPYHTRIRKDGPRGGGCYYCPVKAKCDAMDEVYGQTADWPTDYRKG